MLHQLIDCRGNLTMLNSPAPWLPVLGLFAPFSNSGAQAQANSATCDDAARALLDGARPRSADEM
jgi:hypothetical protein